MGVKPEWQKVAEGIINTHDGQMLFNLTQARKIVGYGENTIARKLHEAGITVKKVGRSKRVTAYDLAELMLKDRVAAID